MVRLSATLISKLIDRSECPFRVNEIYIKKSVRTEPTKAMLAGLFFEQEVLGGKPGNPVSYPKLKSGAKSTDQIRIEDRAALMRNHILPTYGIDLNNSKKFQRFELDFPHDDIKIVGEFDLLCKFNDPQYGIVDAIVDLKLTKNINFEMYKNGVPWSWRWPVNKDHTQAFLYKYVYENLFSVTPKFYYMVSDYKTSPETKIYSKKIGTMEMNELHQSMIFSRDTVINNNKDGWPYNPSFENCKNCPLNKTCTNAILKQPIQEI